MMSGREFKRIMRALHKNSVDAASRRHFGDQAAVFWHYQLAHFGDGNWSLDHRNEPDGLPEDFGGEYMILNLNDAARRVAGSEVVLVHRYTPRDQEYIDSFYFDLVSRTKLLGLIEKD